MKKDISHQDYAYPEWMNLIEQRYQSQFSRLFNKLDQQLTSKVSKRSSSGSYEVCLKILSVKIESGQRINVEMILLESIYQIYGHELHTRKILVNNPDISNTIIELVKIIQEIIAMILYQDTFDKLKEKPIFYN